MIKIFVTFLSLLIINCCSAQKTNLDYLFSFEHNGLESYYSLKTSEQYTLWSEVAKMKIKEDSYDYNVSLHEDENYVFKHVFKNFEDSIMLSNHKILGKKYFMHEKVHVLPWEIIDSTVGILNYTCQLAKISYRGRDYVAFFTTEIPNSYGPWKFHGLPGMILKITSTSNNEFYKMECVEIKKGEQVDFQGVYSKYLTNNEFLTWQQFIVDVNRLIENHVSSLKSRESTSEDGGGGYSIIKLKNYLEIFNQEIQISGVMID